MKNHQADIAGKFEAARKLFPHTRKVVYLNSASYGPFSKPLTDAVKDNLQLRMLAERDDSHDTFASLEYLRKNIASLVGSKPTEIGIGLSTTFGLNIAAYGLPLKKGDEVIISDIEFPALVYTFNAAAKTRGFKVKTIKSTDRCFDIDIFKKSISKKTRLLAISYVQFFNGWKNDLKTISEICKKNNIWLIVDGIQGMGVEPINVKKLGIDIFTSGCQKWMLSPQGCGFFYLSEKVQPIITPPFMSWLSADWKNEFTDMFNYDKKIFDSARKFEMGYYAILNILAMKASLDIIGNLKIKEIQQHNHAIIDLLAEYIDSSSYYKTTSSMKKLHRSSIYTFTSDKLIELHRFILDNKITLVRREGSIRVSVHLFNNKSDIIKLIRVLEKFAKKHG